jgi:hypothetical protein
VRDEWRLKVSEPTYYTFIITFPFIRVCLNYSTNMSMFNLYHWQSDSCGCTAPDFLWDIHRWNIVRFSGYRDWYFPVLLQSLQANAGQYFQIYHAFSLLLIVHAHILISFYCIDVGTEIGGITPPGLRAPLVSCGLWSVRETVGWKERSRWPLDILYPFLRFTYL